MKLVYMKTVAAAKGLSLIHQAILRSARLPAATAEVMLEVITQNGCAAIANVTRGDASWPSHKDAIGSTRATGNLPEPRVNY